MGVRTPGGAAAYARHSAGFWLLLACLSSTMVVQAAVYQETPGTASCTASLLQRRDLPATAQALQALLQDSLNTCYVVAAGGCQVRGGTTTTQVGGLGGPGCCCASLLTSMCHVAGLAPPAGAGGPGAEAGRCGCERGQQDTHGARPAACAEGHLCGHGGGQQLHVQCLRMCRSGMHMPLAAGRSIRAGARGGALVSQPPPKLPRAPCAAPCRP